MSNSHVIDIDRGVSIRQVVKFDPKNRSKFEPDSKYGGMTVYMYKDDPGKYYDVHGKPVPEGVAALAGFPIATYAKHRRRKEALKAFDKQLAQELAMEQEDEEITLAEGGDWKVIAMPMDRAKVVDKETGDMVTATPLSRADALELLTHLTRSAAGDVEPDDKRKTGVKAG
jgi:hypothetical protein